MNIRLFKAKLHRWIYRSERLAKTSRECNKCCVTCPKYFVCLGTDAVMIDIWTSANKGQISDGLAKLYTEQMEKALKEMKG